MIAAPRFNLGDRRERSVGTSEAPELTEQYLRCYIEERETEDKGKGKRRSTRGRNSPGTLSREAEAIIEVGRPYEGYCFVLDWETTTDVRQDPRFLIYHVYGLMPEQRMQLHREGRLDREALDRFYDGGLVYDPDMCTPEEIATMREWAWQNCYDFMERSAFLAVFYKWTYHERALVIGHNLAFDLSRLATSWTQGGGNGPRDFRGGFSLTLCTCEHADCYDHPRLRVKRLGRHKTLFGFAHVRIPAANGSKARTKSYDGKFLDTATLSLALLGPGAVSLDRLGQRLKIDPALRKQAAVHGATIASEYLDYCRHDVALTWAIYRNLRDLYRQHQTTRPMWHVYSEASLSKAYLDCLKMPRFDRRKPPVPRAVIGHGMQSYYGGRTEVNIRLAPTEIELSDFMSEYPTVNALTELQELLLARTIQVRACTRDVRRFLASPDLLEQLQLPQTWRRLRCLVKVRPDGDILPFRSRFGGSGVAAANIALCHVHGRVPTWYTLADVVASVLLTGGKVPEIVEAVELVPRGRVPTKPFQLFGNPQYTVDLSRDDLGVRLIDLRREVISQRERASTDEERDYLDSLQRALKIVANSGSYGVLLEVNAKERTEDPSPVRVYHHEAQDTRAHIVEEPGSYFAGAIGTFIPAGGRLLLALAERLATDRGITYAFCDTDSMGFARPAAMDRETFRGHVADIRAWFTPLSPYEGRPAIFQREKENDFRGKPEPMYCLAISPKRYVLYNRRADGGFRIRKFSAHGTGSYEAPGGYESPADIPAPVDEKGRAADDTGRPVDAYKLGGPRWLYDWWYRAIEQAETGEDCITIADMPGLDVPAMHQVTVSTWNLWQQFKDVPGMRPFNFITVLPALGSALDIATWASAWDYGRKPGEDWSDDVRAKREAREAAERERKEVWKRVRDEGGIRPTATLEDQPIPPGLHRKAGLPLDEVAAGFGFGYEGEFLDWLWDLYHRAKSGKWPGHQAENPYATLRPDTSFYAPFGRSLDDIGGKVRRSDTHVLVEIEHRTMADCLRDYFQHPNYKAADPRHVGLAVRRHVQPTEHVFIGRERNRVLEELEDESEGVLPYPDAEVYARASFGEWLKRESTTELARALGLSTRQVRNLKNGAQPSAETRAKLDAYRMQQAARRRRSSLGSGQSGG